MKRGLIVLLTIVLFINLSIKAQVQPRGNTAQAIGTVKGKIIDANTKEPVEYANIAVFRLDSSLVNGTVTNEKGAFSLEKLPIGNYFLKASFIGYEPKFVDNIAITSAKPNFQLNNVLMNSSVQELEGVEIVAERSMIEYKLDKRVVNVDKNLVTGGGTATDVLENIPSVAVDSDGNITLRGSSSVKILVDGRPAELLGSDMQVILEQIQATEIENVEIVTNPSARYNPEGSSGIINIKLKENKIRGMNSTVSANFGSAIPKFTPTGSASFNINYKTNKWLLYGSIDGNLRSRASDGYTDIQRLDSNRNIYSDIHQKSDNDNKSFNGSLRLGGEYSFDKYNLLSFSYQYRNNYRFGESTIDSKDKLNPLSDYYQKNKTDATGNNNTINLGYRRTFEEKDRELTIDASFSTNSGQDNSTQEYNGAREYIRESDAPSRRNFASVLVNYIHPFSEKTRLEAGYSGDFNYTNNDNQFYLIQNGIRNPDTTSSNHFKYSENINAFYATLGHQFTEKFSGQIGLRYEYVSNSGNVNDAEFGGNPYHSLYPTAHLSYAIDPMQSVQFSYSRRVRRPGMWNLSPYKDVTNPEQIRFGNPNLNAQYTNSFEISYNKGFDKANIFASAYLRHTNKMITHFTFLWNEENADLYGFSNMWDGDTTGRIANTYLNIANGVNYGMELIFDYQLTKWWKFNVSGNLYQSDMNAKDQDLKQNTFLWNIRFSTYLTLPKQWTLQLSGRYNSPRKNLQGKSYSSYWFDLAAKKDVLNKKGTISIRINDIFATGGFRFESETENYISYTERNRLSPYVSVGFTYRMSKGERIRQTQKRNTNGTDEMEPMIEGF